MLPSPNAILIGYFPKQIVPRPEWLKAPGVLDICSVSECMSSGPDDWVNQWRHNEMWMYDTEEIAWSIVGGQLESTSFEIVAYRMVPHIFDNGKAESLAIPPLGVQALPADFRFLGFDVVSRSQGVAFECSPLSCNGVAATEPVNAHCLVDDEKTARRLALAFSNQAIGCEPGPYCIVEVWRR